MPVGLPAALAGFDFSAYSPRRMPLPADFGAADSEPPRVDLSGIASIGPEALRNLAAASRWNTGQQPAMPAFKPVALAGLLGRVPAQLLDMPERQFLDMKPPRILDGRGLI